MENENANVTTKELVAKENRTVRDSARTAKKEKERRVAFFFVYCRNVGCAVCKILQMTRR